MSKDQKVAGSGGSGGAPGASAAAPKVGKATLDPDTQAPLDQVVQVPPGALAFQGGGAVVHGHSADNVLLLESPVVTFDVAVKIPDEMTDKQIDGMISVGSIQNVVTSERVGVYKRPDGSVFESRNLQKGLRDVRWNWNGDPKKDPSVYNKDVVPSVGRGAWYQTPATLSAMARTATARFMDQPAFPVPTRFEGGVLVETRGADKFLTSLAAARGDAAPTHFKQEAWEVPWAVKVDPAKVDYDLAALKATKTDDKPTAFMDFNGPMPMNGKGWIGYPTVADAKHAPPEQLLANLATMRDKDPDSFKNALQAITELNWTLTIMLTCSNSFKWWNDDEVAVTATGLVAKTTNLSITSKQNKSVTARFLELFPDPSKYAGEPITIQIVADGNTLKPRKLAIPFVAAFGDVDDAKRYQLQTTFA